MACIATWSFGLQAVEVASRDIKAGKNCIDVLENAINVVEDDQATGLYYVGRGCYPNREGVVQLDAALMRGSDCSVGAVASLERYPKPISVARRILEHRSLSMLVGNGATQFAIEQGFPMEDNSSLLTPHTQQAYLDFKNGQVRPPPTGHDTLSVACVDKHGHVAVGVSTSGPPFKPPGRVGDSPLPGCGFYADDQGGGAAAATGDGDRIMQFCPSFHIVQLIKSGRSPQQACEEVVAHMKTSNVSFEVGVVAVNTKGEVGGAGTVQEWKDIRTGVLYKGFPFAHWTADTDRPFITTVPVVQ